MINENDQIQLLNPNQSLSEWIISSGMENPEFDHEWMRRAWMSAIRYDRLDIIREILDFSLYLPGDIYEALMEAHRLEKKEIFHLIISRNCDQAWIMGTVHVLARWYHNDCLLGGLEREGVTSSNMEEDYLIPYFSSNNSQNFFQFAASEIWLDETVENVLCNAVVYKNEKMLEWGISSAGSRIARLGGQALINACHAGNLSFAQQLIHAGVNVDYEENGSYSRPIQAAAGEYPDIVTLLLEHGANPHGCDDCNYGSAMWHAAWKGNIKSIRILLECGCSPDDAETTGQTPLVAALSNHHFKAAEYLLAHSADIDHSNMMNKNTPLMEMVMLKRFSAVRFLVEHGASLDIITYDQTAYDLAKQYSTPKIKAYLGKLSLQNINRPIE